jgi:hypothetical protein
MTKAMSSRGALGVLGSFYSAIVMGCATQPAPPVDVHLPVIEHEIFVELPSQTRLNATELKRQYYEGRRTIGHIRERCVGQHEMGKPCTTGTTDVRITAVEGAKYIRADKAPDRPQLIAWIENLGKQTTFDGIQPMTEAIYALVVDSRVITGSEHPTILRVAFPPYQKARSDERAQMTEYGSVNRCHAYGQPYISAADYEACTPYLPRRVFSSSRGWNGNAVFTSLVSWMSQLASDDPTWFSCSSGCCTSTAVQ